MTQVLWTQRQDIGPEGRTAHVMAYDRGRQRTVLFGGRISGGTVVGDTWEWDGTDWTQVADTGPDPRSGHAMAYGAALVLFGGEDATSTLRGGTGVARGSDEPAPRRPRAPRRQRRLDAGGRHRPVAASRSRGRVRRGPRPAGPVR